jgi:transcriptional regulator with XRE-family HTH domain
MPATPDQLEQQAIGLKEARGRQGWSQTQLAQQLRTAARKLGRVSDLPHSDQALLGYISYYENGRRSVSDRLKPIFREAYGASDTDLGFASGSTGIFPADLGLGFPNSADEGAGTVTRLWRADLQETTSLLNSPVSASAWNDISLKWLLAGSRAPTLRTAGVRVGRSDVERVRVTTELFAQLDNRFGGGHARRALIQLLATDVEQLLGGQFSEETGRALFSAVAESTLVAAWMAYDSCLHSLAQRYFIQALALAEAGQDRLLAGSVLDAMSHQATFMGRFQDAANLARAANLGTHAVATPTLTAHFHVMEARALARLGDARACDLALSAAVTMFERRVPEDDPEWIRYFDDAELAAEFGHCFRDLGRPVDATQYATQCLGDADGTYLRSDFFATMVLADAHLRAGDVEQACDIALHALSLGEQLKSARCASYLREFRTELSRIGPTLAARELEEQAVGSTLWEQAKVA